MTSPAGSRQVMSQAASVPATGPANAPCRVGQGRVMRCHRAGLASKKRLRPIRRATVAAMLAGMVTTLLTGCTGSSGGTADPDGGPPLPNAAMAYGTLRDVRY